MEKPMPVPHLGPATEDHPRASDEQNAAALAKLEARFEALQRASRIKSANGRIIVHPSADGYTLEVRD